MQKLKSLLGVLVVVTILAFTNMNTSWGVPLSQIMPSDACFRIDVNPHTGPTLVASWYEISYHGNWGQAQCSEPGNDCHLWDWATWWECGVWVPSPPSGWTSIYGQGDVPIYNPIIGEYVYGY